jgi:hypothetical protein
MLPPLHFALGDEILSQADLITATDLFGKRTRFAIGSGCSKLNCERRLA